MMDGGNGGVETRMDPEDTISGKDPFVGMRFVGRPYAYKNDSRSPASSGHASPALKPSRHVVIDEGILEPPENSLFIRAVLWEAGLELGGYRLAPLVRRIPACLRALRVPTVSDAIKALQEDASRLRTAVNALLIGTTSFFRDAPLFARIEEHLLPDLLHHTSSPRIWSAGCSDGSELYSIAMLVSEIDPQHDACFLGSDCRPSVLETAKAGIYSSDAVQRIRPAFRERYLVKRGVQHAIRQDLTDRIDWKQLDLLGKPADGKWDMILCRNVAIYLEAESGRHMWNRLAGALNPNGILITGRAENPWVDGLTRIGPSIFRKDSSPGSPP